MAQPAKNTRALGRGLSSLMGESVTAIEVPVPLAISINQNGTLQLPTNQLQPGKYQPRRHFEDAALAELADSVEKHGIMQPIVVRLVDKNLYEIIAGERRWRAAKLAKMAQVPVIIREVNDEEALELALIENIQRSDLNPLEEAAGYARLMDEFGYTQERLAPIVGKSRSHIANLLRLLKLPESIKQRIDAGALTMGHARALLMADDPEKLAQQIVVAGLSVRQAEERAKGASPIIDKPQRTTVSRHTTTTTPRSNVVHKNEDVLQLEQMLCESMGLRVSINTYGGQAGEVVISYDSLSQLDEILRRLGN